MAGSRRPTTICILGMHRSGTSAVTRLLNLLGMHLGPEEHLIPGAEGNNPTGFWEHMGFFEINEEILRHFGGSWYDPPQFQPGWETFPELSDLRKRAQALVGEEFKGAEVWGWKDPRNCLTLPFWQQVIPGMRYVICLRNPLEVMRSLRERDQLSAAASLRIWLDYTVEGFRHTAGKPRLITCYEDYFLRWGVEIKRLAGFAGLKVPPRGSLRYGEMQKSLRRDLRHHEASLFDAMSAGDLGFPAKALYLTLRTSLSEAAHRRQKAPIVQDQAIDAFVHGLQAHQGEIRHLTVCVANLEGIQRNLEEALTRKDDEIAQLRPERERLVRQAAQLQARVEAQQQALREKEQQAAQSMAEGERLAQEAAQLQARVEAQQQALREKEQQVTQSMAERERLAQEAVRLQTTVQAQAQVLNTIHSSIGWRLVAYYWRVRDKLIPNHTRRRKLYDLAIKGMKIILNDGFKQFLIKVKGKFYRHLNSRSHLQSQEMININGRDLPAVDIIVPVYNAFDDFKKCIESVLSSTEEKTYRLVIIDDASTNPLVKDYLEYLDVKGLSHVLIMRNSDNVGFVRTANRGMAQSRHRDVVLLNSDTIVTTGWLKRLQRSAYSDEKIATVTPLSNNATICSVPEFCEANDLPDGYSISEFANVVLTASEKNGKQIEIPTAIGFCMFIKRQVLNEIGLFDEIFGKGYNEENDFCMRARKEGYRHVVDASTFVYHKGKASFQAEQVVLENENADLLVSRHASYPEVVENFIRRNPLKKVQDSIKRSIIPRSVARHESLKIGIDGQLLWRAKRTGTERYISSLVDNVKALNAKNNYIVYGKPDDSEIPSGQFVRRFATDSLDILLDSEAIDVIHRTCQCFSVYDLLLLLKARSSVITILDLISCKEPEYFPSLLEHEKYMQLMRVSLIVADRIIAISYHTKEDLIKTFNLPGDKIDVIYPGFSGIDPMKMKDRAVKWPFPSLRRGEYLLYVGTDYPHKNHDKLIEAFRKLVNERNMSVKLVIAGPSISPIRRQEIKSLIGDIRERVVYLEYVDDDTLGELYKGAAAYIFPSLYEGFGFTPLEAMAHGIPIVASKATSIPEVVGDAAVLVNAESIEELCDAICSVMSDTDLRNKLIERGFEQVSRFSWKDTALKTVSTYHKAWETYAQNGPPKISGDIKSAIISMVAPAPNNKLIEETVNRILTGH